MFYSWKSNLLSHLKVCWKIKAKILRSLTFQGFEFPGMDGKPGKQTHLIWFPSLIWGSEICQVNKVWISHVYWLLLSSGGFQEWLEFTWNCFFFSAFHGTICHQDQTVFMKEAGTRAGPIMQQRRKPLVDWSKSCKDKVWTQSTRISASSWSIYYLKGPFEFWGVFELLTWKEILQHIAEGTLLGCQELLLIPLEVSWIYSRK